MAKLHLLTIGILSMLLFSIISCNPLATQGPEPAFLNISAIEFIHDFEKGPRLHQIDHVEIFFENFSIGYYELPAEIAVIPTKEVSNLTIRPAIRENGGKNTITVYNMMTSYIVDQTFEAFETYEINPQVDYASNVVFDLVETFESSNSMTFDLDGIDSTMLVRTTKDANDGSYSGLLSSENGRDILVGSDFLFTDLDNDRRDVFIEFEYRNDIPFEIGMYAFGGGNSLEIPYIFTFPARAQWNKVYLNFTPAIFNIPSEGYRIFLRTNSSSSFLSEVFIDNLKLLHIQ